MRLPQVVELVRPVLWPSRYRSVLSGIIDVLRASHPDSTLDDRPLFIEKAVQVAGRAGGRRALTLQYPGLRIGVRSHGRPARSGTPPSGGGYLGASATWSAAWASRSPIGLVGPAVGSFAVCSSISVFSSAPARTTGAGRGRGRSGRARPGRRPAGRPG